MAVEEFSLIERYFKNSQASLNTSDLDVGIGDDAAILSPPAGQRLCVAVDTLVSGVHFPENTAAYDIGYKALAVNLSDLAAMGASPYAFTLALTLPNTKKHWLASFSEGLFTLAKEHKIPLVGGDTTRGPLTISVQVLGLLPRQQALLRGGANVGDDIYVSGNVGDAGLGLQIQQGKLLTAEGHQQYLLSRLNRPTPRLALGQALLGLASAAIDVSDGLLVDLKHILDASQVGARIKLDGIPLSPAYQACADSQNAPLLHRYTQALEAGDDYELCFSAAKGKREQVEALKTHLPITRIGEIIEQKTLQCLDANGVKFDYDPRGFEHF